VLREIGGGLRLSLAAAILLLVALALTAFLGMMWGYQQSSSPRVCAYLPLPGKNLSAPVCEQGIPYDDFDQKVNP
jgi:hypothetical protein